MKWYLEVLRKYATFSGRARRKEYWMFQLFNIIIYLVIYAFISLGSGPIISVVYCLYFIYALGIIIPSLAVLVRRLHDIDKSGAWFFISFIPIIGSIWLLILTCTEGSYRVNYYGPPPSDDL